MVQATTAGLRRRLLAAYAAVTTVVTLATLVTVVAVRAEVSAPQQVCVTPSAGPSTSPSTTPSTTSNPSSTPDPSSTPTGEPCEELPDCSTTGPTSQAPPTASVSPTVAVSEIATDPTGQLGAQLGGQVGGQVGAPALSSAETPSDPEEYCDNLTECFLTGDNCEDLFADDGEPVFNGNGDCEASSSNCDDYPPEDDGSGGGGADPPAAPNAEALTDLPVLVALGDSVSSGHHKERNGATRFEAPDYAYGGDLHKKLVNHKPDDSWRFREQYHNFARSGFSTLDVLAGGTNAGGTNYPTPPIRQAEQLLETRRNRGNLLVMTLGINDSNWSKLLAGVVRKYVANRLRNGQQCEQVLRDGGSFPGFAFAGWDFVPGSTLVRQVKANVENIIRRLLIADPGLHIVVYQYYNMADTGMNDVAGAAIIDGVFRTNFNGPYLPKYCETSVETRRDLLNDEVAKGVTNAFNGNAQARDQRVTFTREPRLDRNREVLQSLFIDQVIKDSKIVPGWPHPNRFGHQLIAENIFQKVKTKL